MNTYVGPDYLYESTNVMKLDARMRFHILKMMFYKVKFDNNLFPKVVNRDIVTRAHVGPVLVQLRPGDAKYAKSFHNTCIQLWKSLPSDVRQINNFVQFQRALRNHILS